MIFNKDISCIFIYEYFYKTIYKLQSYTLDIMLTKYFYFFYDLITYFSYITIHISLN